MKWLLRLILVAVFGLFFSTFNSQDIFADEDELNEFMLEEITVTAQKRSENQQKVPIAMDVISGEQITDLGQNNIDQILSNNASVLINTAGDGFRVSIRGISNDNALPGEQVQQETPTVAVNKDGVYNNKISYGTNLYDVERVEVLFGPQSTLYASASPGGVVNIITTDPKIGTYEASGTLEYGSYDLLSTEGVVNAPAGSKLALRAAFSTSVRDGYLSNGSDDEDRKSARLRALYQPTDTISVVLSGELLKDNSRGFSAVEVFDDQDEVDDPWTASTDTVDPPRQETQESLYGRIEWDLGKNGFLTITPSYSQNDRASTTTTTGGRLGENAVTVADLENSGEQKGVELRMTSSDESAFKWIAGFNWYKSVEDGYRVRTTTVPDTEIYQYNVDDLTNTQESQAVYGNVTYPVADRLRATAGMRYSWDKNLSHQYQIGAYGEVDTDKDVKYDHPDYKLGIEYDLSEQSMLFADWSSSYRINSGYQVDPDGNPFPPEELNAYSIGIKNRFFDNRLQLNASAYYYDYRNYIAFTQLMTIYDENDNGVRDADETTVTEDTNGQKVGDARVYGLDLQTSTIFTDNDKLDLSVSYLRKYWTDLYFDYLPITNSLGIPDIDYSGKDMTNAPRWTVTAAFSHNLQMPNGGFITARLDTRYQSSYKCAWNDTEFSFNRDYTDVVVTDNSDTYIQEAHFISNFSAIYNDPDGKWKLTGYVKNLENYAAKRSLLRFDMLIGPPRTYGVIFSVNFN